MFYPYTFLAYPVFFLNLFPVMSAQIIDFRPDWDDLSRINHGMTKIIMTLDVMEIDGFSHMRPLIQLPQVA